MDKEALKKDVETIVKTIFSEKEDTDKKRLTEEALKDSAKVVTDLTASVVEKDDVIINLESEISEAEETIAKQVESIDAEKAKVDELTKQLEDITNKLNASELKVADMEKDMAADAHMADLKESKVISTDEKIQREKVREMSDEEFASYKKELVGLRSSIEAELASTAPVVTPDGDTTTVTTDVVTPDMNINVDNSAQAALNLEVSPDDVASNYTELGKAMAAAWVEDKS